MRSAAAALNILVSHILVPKTCSATAALASTQSRSPSPSLSPSLSQNIVRTATTLLVSAALHPSLLNLNRHLVLRRSVVLRSEVRFTDARRWARHSIDILPCRREERSVHRKCPTPIINFKLPVRLFTRPPTILTSSNYCAFYIEADLSVLISNNATLHNNRSYNASTAPSLLTPPTP
jgi:hypothetical protein